jgi:hypothetical protein
MIEWPDSKNESAEKRGISGIRAKALHLDPIKENEINSLMKKREKSFNNPPSN